MLYPCKKPILIQDSSVLGWERTVSYEQLSCMRHHLYFQEAHVPDRTVPRSVQVENAWMQDMYGLYVLFIVNLSAIIKVTDR